MRLKTLLRSGPALWVALALVPALLWVSVQNLDSTIAYWESASSQSTLVLGFVSAACGACAAWESSRLEAALIYSWAPSRGRLRIAAEHLAPVAVLGLLGIFVALAVFAGPAMGGPGFPNPAVLATAYLVVLSHIAVGYLVGRKAPQVLGAAGMLITGYFWGFWPAALGEPSWLRHLNGQGVGDCCSLDQETSLRSLGATAAFSIGLIAAAMILLALRNGRLRVLVAAATGLAGIAIAVMLAVPLGFNGAQAREASALQCTGRQPQVCLWPEQRSRKREFLKWAHSAADRLRAVGIDPPARVEYGRVEPVRSEVPTDTAATLLPTDSPSCNASDDAETVIYPWLALTAGEDASSLQKRWPPEAVALAQQVRKLPPRAQKTWFDHNMRAVRDCTVKPRLSPSSYATTRKSAP
ncbi:hypothetical protein [Streptomyces sp. NPDC048639]|uniref:DUF7224 domain-containing protein n=1 Tax=Streptomyces sp. NPDC048639 TaxID=3365581 RepID=UPI00371FC8BC